METYGKEDHAERLHQFEVVCRTALKINAVHSKKRPSAGGILALGQKEFGLTEPQAKYCLGRARNFFIEVRERERLRNKLNLKLNPTKYEKV